MEELLHLGGPILWVQIGITFFALLLIFEKLLFFQTTRLRELDILTGLGNHLKKRAYAEARHEASQCKGPMGRVLYTIVTRHHLERIELRGLAEDAVGLELPQIENNVLTEDDKVMLLNLYINDYISKNPIPVLVK